MPKREPYISVIVPFYQAETTLENAIKSVLNQDFTNWELILINDGSTDSSAQIANLYCNMDSRIKLLTQRNMGRSVARNTGIRKARGSWITFLDSDDQLLQGCFSSLINSAKSNSHSQIISGRFSKTIIKNNSAFEHPCLITISGLSFLKITINRPKYTKLLNLTIPDSFSLDSVWSKLYKKDLFSTNALFFSEQIKFGEDSIFNYLAYSKASHITLVDKPVYYYSDVEQGTMRQFEKNDFIELDKQLTATKRILNNLVAEKIVSEQDKLYALGRIVYQAIVRAEQYSNDLMIYKNELNQLLDCPDIRKALNSYRDPSLLGNIYAKICIFLLGSKQFNYFKKLRQITRLFQNKVSTH